MGGSGSGNWYRWDSKTTTESQHRIDIRWLKKQGYLRPGNVGSLSWSWGDEQTVFINYRMETDRMVLNCLHWSQGEGWEDVEQAISFYRTPCNYGGFRTWFLCPRCWQRIAVLYGAGKYFLCRHCYNLTYASQQESREDRLMRKARKIRRRLGMGDDLMEPIWFKPKNMHQKTFNRLCEEAKQAENLGWIVAGQRFGLGII
jgi:hypothetical protein